MQYNGYRKNKQSNSRLHNTNFKITGINDHNKTILLIFARNYKIDLLKYIVGNSYFSYYWLKGVESFILVDPKYKTRFNSLICGSNGPLVNVFYPPSPLCLVLSSGDISHRATSTSRSDRTAACQLSGDGGGPKSLTYENISIFDSEKLNQSEN
jgi:hypothetical protein